MHLRFVALMVVVALPALADVPGPKEVCNAPAECVGCSVSDPDCVAGAEDAGLVRTGCSTRRGTPVNYYCPPGVEPVQSCGCSGALDAALVFGALALLGRRFKK